MTGKKRALGSGLEEKLTPTSSNRTNTTSRFRY